MTTLSQASLLFGKTFKQVLKFCQKMNVSHDVFGDYQIRMHDTDNTDAVFGFRDGKCIVQSIGAPVINNSVALSDRHVRYQAVMSELLNPMSAPWPPDGFPNMARRVAMVLSTSPQARASAGLRAKQAIPDGLTTQERRNWIDGQNQIGG